MTNYILVGRNGRPSIRAVAKYMNSDVKVLMRRKFRSGSIKWTKLSGNYENWIPHLPLNTNPSFNEDDIVIRWGISTPLRFNGAKVYQRGDVIDNISNKFRSRIIMEGAGIPIPNTSDDYRDLEFPMIARPYYHSRGRNLFVCNNTYDINRLRELTPLYFSEIYNKEKEYRVHVGHGKVLLIQEKPIVNGVIQANRAITHEQWRVIPWSEYDRRICIATCNAVHALGGDIGGVDIMTNSNNEMPVCVCEINAAPTIKSSEYSTTRYAKYFNWLFRNKREWWNYRGWNVGKSFAFKNQQLAD